MTDQVRALNGVEAVQMVATREIVTRVRTRAFVVANGIILAAIAGGLILTALLQGHFGKPPKVALVGPASVLSAPLMAADKALAYDIEVRQVASEAEARQQVRDGHLRVALIRHGAGYLAITKKRLEPRLQNVLATGIKQQALTASLTSQQVNQLQLAAAVGRATLTVDALKPPKPDADTRTALAYASVSLLYFQLFTICQTVASSVVEEKTSRVVELLLSAIKPVQLLVGKVVGVGIVGMLQVLAYGAVALTVGRLTGLLHVSGAAATAFVATLGWFLLGFAFLGTLYAAAGSMVSRQEEIGSTTAPFSMLVVAMFVVAQAAVQNPDGTMASVMSWIPPFCAILMPLRIAAGVAGPFQVMGTVVLMLVGASGLALLSARIYQRSILRMGTRVSWKQAFGRG